MQIKYTPYLTKEKSIAVPEFNLNTVIGVKKPSIIQTEVKSPTTETLTSEQTPIQRGTTIFKSSDINVGNMQEVLDKFNENGISVRVTSGLRPGALTSNGSASHHSNGNAIDITPGEGETWETLKSKLKNSPNLIKWLQEKGYGILDETNSSIMTATGATGAHWHIGPDESAKHGLLGLLAKKGGILKAQQGSLLVETYPLPYEKQFDLSQNIFTKKVEKEVKDELNDIEGVDMNNLHYIAKRLKQAGFNNLQLATILSSVIHESKAKPNAIGDNGKAKGLLQWHPDRFFAGEDIDSQIDLIIKEVNDYKNVNAWIPSKRFSKKNAINAFNGDDLFNVVSSFTANFIRPNDTDFEIQRRYALAKEIFDQLA